MGYAEGTTVSAEATVSEIERIVNRWNADEFGYGRKADTGMVFFRLHDRQVRFMVPLPNRQDAKFQFTNHASPRKRTEAQARDAWEQAVREQWRALAIVIKAKLVAVDAGVVTFEQEFGMHFVLPGGGTVYDQVAPQIEAAYANDGVPGMLHIGGAK